MKPEQKFMLSCRQTGKAAGRLSDWLEHNPLLLGTAHAAVCEDIACLAADLTPLAAAAETQPGIALVSTSAAAKSELLFSLLAIRSQTVVGELGQRPMDAATIRTLLPSGQQACCAIVRFSSDELPPAPRGFPIHVGLLSIVDIAVIITGASLSSSGPLAPLPGLAQISDMFPELASRLSPQALPGLSERDVLDLRDQLNARWPGEATLARLAAARYWDQFREIAAHLPDRDRRRVLALLWRNDTAYTKLFERLCDGLDKLGQGADAYCPTEALLGKDKASGWLTRHPRSIIDDATLRTIDQVPGPMLAMMNRYGQTVDIERSVVAGLISEMTLHLATSRLTDLAPADLLDFPAPPPIASVAPLPAHATSSWGDDLDAAIAHFARTKAVYLFERACHRRDTTSVVIVIDPDQDDDTYAQAIGDWVETMQGPNAHSRERVRRGLFVAALSGPHAGAPDDARVQSIIRDVIGTKQEWPTAWTPNRPMTEVFWFAPDETASAQHNLNAGQASTVLATIAPPLGSVAQRSQSNIAHLLSALTLASNPRAKQLQLHQALQEKRRHIRQTVLRHHTSNDPSALAHWRRSTAVVVQDRLQFIIDQGRLGLLHRALMPGEGDLIVPIRAAEHVAAAKSAASSRAAPWLEAGASEARSLDIGRAAAPLQAGAMANIAVAHWFGCMRRSARSLRLCRDLRIEMGVMHHLVDELQIGALRCGLASEITNAYLQAAPHRAIDPVNPASGGPARLAPAERDLIRLTAYACRIITAYLEVLGTVQGRGHAAHTRGPRASGYDLEVAGSASSGYGNSVARPLTGGRRTTRAALDQWEVSFVALVEDNITSAHMIAGRGDKDRELGELIHLFASGPFEVEP